MTRRALITNEFAPSHGGVERLLHERARAFEPDRLTVFCPQTVGCEAFDAAQPYAVKRAQHRFRDVPGLRDVARSIAPFRDCWQAHRRRRFDLIECGQAFPASLFAWFLRRLYGTPYMVWVHGNDLLGPARYRLLALALRRSLRAAQAVITNSSYTARIVASFGIPAARIRVIAPVVDTRRFRPATGLPALRDRYRIRDRKVLLTVCRLVERKGVDMTLEALARAVAVRPDILYLIVGEGPQRSELESLAWNLGLRDHVVFCGAVSDEELPLHYHLASAFVMPSRYIEKEGSVEGLGLVYLEAMASGVPVIAGRSGGVPDIVRDDDTGLLVDPGSVTQLAAAILSLLTDDNLAERLAARALAFVRTPRDWSVLDAGS
jgi:phosphatidylinositol alpha-1,6-mannosyltransferase